ncbi:hypothetical protein [Streptomyces sp. M54]|uniref:hypothetical protein n=1 Tax=Streptomyces sp. M54 TaxID=2759525 RepID=UPI001A8D46BA|nr:hypothetical protein [Streptomyces sp. M54]QSS89584.1 hypothetical protein H3V39_03420 [Streptomyces sp. M54]
MHAGREYRCSIDLARYRFAGSDLLALEAVVPAGDGMRGPAGYGADGPPGTAG